MSISRQLPDPRDQLPVAFPQHPQQSRIGARRGEEPLLGHRGQVPAQFAAEGEASLAERRERRIAAGVLGTSPASAGDAPLIRQCRLQILLAEALQHGVGAAAPQDAAWVESACHQLDAGTHADARERELDRHSRLQPRLNCWSSSQSSRYSLQCDFLPFP